MYSPKIGEEQVKALYLLREELREQGIKRPMTDLVKEALEEYLTKKAEPCTTQRSALKKVI